jgi:hypothetical protein
MFHCLAVSAVARRSATVLLNAGRQRTRTSGKPNRRQIRTGRPARAARNRLCAGSDQRDTGRGRHGPPCQWGLANQLARAVHALQTRTMRVVAATQRQDREAALNLPSADRAVAKQQGDHRRRSKRSVDGKLQFLERAGHHLGANGSFSGPPGATFHSERHDDQAPGILLPLGLRSDLPALWVEGF